MKRIFLWRILMGAHLNRCSSLFIGRRSMTRQSVWTPGICRNWCYRSPSAGPGTFVERFKADVAAIEGYVFPIDSPVLSRVMPGALTFRLGLSAILRLTDMASATECGSSTMRRAARWRWGQGTEGDIDPGRLERQVLVRAESNSGCQEVES